DLPAEVRRCLFERRRDVAEPQWAVAAVLQKVEAEESQEVFAPGHAYLRLVQTDEPRARVKAVPTPFAEQREGVVLKVYERPALQPLCPDGGLCRLVLLRPHAEVYVTGRAKAALGVQAGRGQPLQQDRLYARAAQSVEDV